MFFLILAIIKTKGANLLWNKTNLGDITFKSHQSAFTLCKIYITNILAVVVTLGLARPWTICRLAHYRANTMQVFVETEGELDTFVSHEGNKDHSAIADAGDDFFNFDIGVW